MNDSETTGRSSGLSHMLVGNITTTTSLKIPRLTHTAIHSFPEFVHMHPFIPVPAGERGRSRHKLQDPRPGRQPHSHPATLSAVGRNLVLLKLSPLRSPWQELLTCADCILSAVCLVTYLKRAPGHD